MTTLTIWDWEVEKYPLQVGVGVIIGGWTFVKLVNYFLQRSKLKSARVRKRAECKQAKQVLEDQIKQRNISKEVVEEITNLSLSELQSKLKDGTLDVLDVLHAYQAKALECDEKTNCIIEPFKEAEEWAASVKENVSKDSPLFGVPVSLKENYGVEGYDSVYGMSVLIGKPSHEDSVIGQVLRSQGAIPYVRTNVPQTMISWDCSNPVFGATKNPHDTTRTPGGSSGGECALLAGQGSILGFGSDIGGSLRIPSNMCGTYGFKPTVGRLSAKGTHGCTKGQQIVRAAYGPLARDVDGLVTAMKALLVPLMFKLDPTVNPLPFRTEVFEDNRKLKIGWYDNDGWFTPPPCMQRGVAIAKAKLEAMGHTLVPWKPPNATLGAELYVRAMFSDKCETINEMLRYDTLDVCFMIQYTMANIYWPLRRFLVFILHYLMPSLSTGLKAIAGCDSAYDFWNLAVAAEDYRKMVIEDWQSHDLDAVISPGFGCPAIPLKTPALATSAVSYTTIFNVLNFPAGSLPVTKVNAADTANMKDYPTIDLAHKTVKKGMVGAEGLPVNVQCITLPWHEEQCLRVMKDLETALKA
ncbi:unnamed protein product [Owenia fusiformis]|uniref:fatty acid amide hydrolase n=1 Tax=Owenia fusiformis TaxID=6347 RepID=A0A8J1TQ18_OWEFU|nr:unnamed protein product [Owenia fusiformis]